MTHRYSKWFWDGYHRVVDACIGRVKTGEHDYHHCDFTKKAVHLMTRDLIEEIIQELYDVVNYAIAQIIKLEKIRDALDFNKDIQNIAPSSRCLAGEVTEPATGGT